MMRQLTHEEAFATLDAAALDVLEGSERIAVFSHVEGCAICRAELDSLRSTAAQLAFSTALAADSPTASRGRVRSKLMSRVANEKRGRHTPPANMVMLPVGTLIDTVDHATPARPRAAHVPLPPARTGWGATGWAALAASVLLIASLGLNGVLWQDRSRLEASLETNSATTQFAQLSTDSLRAALASRDSMLATLTGRDVAMMTLTSSAAKAPYARMFWDQTRNTWTLIAHNLPALSAGRTYQLWLVTPTAKISGGTFAVRNGDAMVRMTYAMPADSLRAIAITEEPAGGAPQPTGAPVIAATPGTK